MNFKLSGAWKKIGSDEHFTTLQHSRGHIMKIARKGLSSKLREQMDSLAHDGAAPKAKMEQSAMPAKEPHFDQGGAVGGSAPTLGSIIGYPGADQTAPKDDKKTKQYAEGGDVDAQPQAPVTINIGGNGQMPSNLINPTAQQPQAPVQAPIPAAPEPQGEPIDFAHADYKNEPTPADAPYGSGPPTSAAATPPPGQMSSPSQASRSPAGEMSASATPGQPQKPSDPYGTQAYYDAYTKGVGETKQGLQQQAQGEAQLGQQQAQQLQHGQQIEQAALETYQTHYAQLDDERKKFMQDLQNQHIDPKHYLNNMGTGSKIATAIGLIAGGIGSGIVGGENPAMKFLNMQIDRDIEAQKAELGKSENLLSANLKQFGNMKDATDMSRVMQSDILSNQLKMAAAQAQTPLSKARLLEASGKLDMDSAPVLSQMAMRKTLLSGARSGAIAPEQVIRMIVPEKQQEMAYKELAASQGTKKAANNIMTAFDQISSMNTTAGKLNPQNGARIDAILGSVLPGLSKETAGRFTEQDAAMLEKTLRSKFWASEETRNTARMALQRLISEKMNFPMLNAYGIDTGWNAPQANKYKEQAPVINSR